MANGHTATLTLGKRLAFFLQFLRSPLQIGSVTPSSRYLEQRLLDTADIATARTIVELGPGTGGTTRAILRAMAPAASLLCIEINPRFHQLIRTINDSRLIAHLGSACDLQAALRQYRLDAPDVVISGIPFSTMPREAGAGILAAISSALASNGRFVAYQASDRVASLCRPFMGAGRMELEVRNLPPMRVFRWEKRAGGSRGVAP